MILDAVDDAIVVVDAGGSVVLQNQLYSEFFGYGVSAPAFTDAKGPALTDERSPISRASRGESFTTTFYLHSSSGVATHYEAMGRPAVAGGLRLWVLTIRPFAKGDEHEGASENGVRR